MIVPVILSGGNGSRLWPLSRQAFPKQFLPVPGTEETFLQTTVKRCKGLSGFDQLIVVGNENHRFLILEQLENIAPQATVILEPEARNTAPAMGLVALWAQEHLPPEAQLLFLPSDHLIPDADAFGAAVQRGAALAAAGQMVTFGIQPTYAETGYGYIERGDVLGDGFQVKSFQEKPDLATAETYLQRGTFYWNGGIFLATAATLLNAFQAYAPALLSQIEKAVQPFDKERFFWRPQPTAFEQCEEISIDYALMEKTENCVVVPFTGSWNDIGSFAALWEVSNQDADGNVVLGEAILNNCKNCYVHAEHDSLVTATDLQDQVIIHTPDATLILPTDKAQNVKQLYSQLKQRGDTRYIEHTTDYRPWGGYTNLAEGKQDAALYKVKHLWVKPGGRLSLQSHEHRSEHWIVLSGTATVTKDDETLTLAAGASVFLPVGTKHRLENLGEIPLHLIEVQTGDYFGEDDITRYDDVYGRN